MVLRSESDRHGRQHHPERGTDRSGGVGVSDPTNTAAMATELPDARKEAAGFVMLGLAQLVCIFAFWMAIWPSSFGVNSSSELGLLFGGLFGAAAAVGFYLAFQALSLDA
jgi:hypothetical protein